MTSRALGEPLPRSFYRRPTAVVARALLGCRLETSGPGGRRIGRVVETEAYVSGDPANHAFQGPTARNRSMFAGAGTLYVYRIHQVHCANAVTRRGEAVLLRAVEPISEGLADARGPGRLCRAFGIEREQDGTDLLAGPVRFYPRSGPLGPVVRAPRVGISRARERPLRFAILGNPFVSSPKPWGRRRFSA